MSSRWSQFRPSRVGPTQAVTATHTIRFRCRRCLFRCVSSGSHTFVFSSHTCPAAASLLPQRSPPRLLTDAACGGLGSPPARRTRRAVLHHRHSAFRSGDPLHRHHSTSGHTSGSKNPAAVRDQRFRPRVDTHRSSRRGQADAESGRGPALEQALPDVADAVAALDAGLLARRLARCRTRRSRRPAGPGKGHDLGGRGSSGLRRLDGPQTRSDEAGRPYRAWIG